MPIGSVSSSSKLQIFREASTYEGSFACQSICSVISLHSGMSAAVYPQVFLKVDVNHWHISVWASHSQQHSSSVYCWCLCLFSLQPYWSIRQNGQQCQCVLALHALLTVAILEGLTLRKFRLNIYVCFMFAWGLVLWIGFVIYIYEKSFKVCLWQRSPWYICTGWLGVKHQFTYLLVTEFDPPEVTLCSFFSFFLTALPSFLMLNCCRSWW